jgi:hypothetical protein
MNEKIKHTCMHACVCHLKLTFFEHRLVCVGARIPPHNARERHIERYLDLKPSLYMDDYLGLYFPSFHQVTLAQATADASKSKSGWLTKKGGRIGTWKRRWCVLAGEKATLYYYDNNQVSEREQRVEFDTCYSF